MPVSIRFHPSNLTEVVISGEVPMTELGEALLAMYRDPRFVAPSRVLWDMGDQRMTMKPEEIIRFREFVKENRAHKGGRTALLASSDLAFGLSRMFEMQAADLGPEIRVFRDREGALAWLEEPGFPELVG